MTDWQTVIRCKAFDYMNSDAWIQISFTECEDLKNSWSFPIKS